MLTGVILAGGQNRRMGGAHKALLPFRNESLIKRQIRIMKQLCSEMILVTNDPKTFLPLLGDTIRIITDYFPGKGPLSGMHAALTLAKNTDLWVVGCDMPFISSKAAEFMRKRKTELECAAVVPYVAGKVHPLHGIYDKSSVETVSRLLNKGDYRVMELFDTIYWEQATEMQLLEQGVDLRFVTNVNTPEDYENALKMENQSPLVG